MHKQFKQPSKIYFNWLLVFTLCGFSLVHLCLKGLRIQYCLYIMWILKFWVMQWLIPKSMFSYVAIHCFFFFQNNQRVLNNDQYFFHNSSQTLFQSAVMNTREFRYSLTEKVINCHWFCSSLTDYAETLKLT